MRTFIQALTMAAVALLFAVGCETAADQQRKADQAQAEANEKAARAQADADRYAQNAQARADREIAEAQEDFSKLREDFRHDLQVKLVDVDKDIADLRAKSMTASGKTKQKIDDSLPIIDERRARLNDAFQRLEQANANSWAHAKGEVERRWNELKDSVDSAT